MSEGEGAAARLPQAKTDWISEVQRLRLLPGDILVIRAEQTLHPAAVARIRQHLEELLGGEQRVIVLDAGLEIGVLTPGDADANSGALWQ